MESYTDIFRFMSAIKDRIFKACKTEMDAILATSLGMSGCPLARARGILFFYALPMPGLATREFPYPWSHFCRSEESITC